MGVKTASQCAVSTNRFSLSSSGAVSTSITASTGGTVFTGGRILSGSNIFVADGYKYHIFTSSGTLSVTGSGVVDVLVVGGGGGGGAYSDGNGGDGGTVTLTTATVTTGDYTVILGAGGTGGQRGAYTSAVASTAGTSSSISGSGVSVTASGGARGYDGYSASPLGTGLGGSGQGGTSPIFSVSIATALANVNYSGNSGRGQNGASDNGFFAHMSGYFANWTDKLGTNSYFGGGGGGGCHRWASSADTGNQMSFGGLGGGGGSRYSLYTGAPDYYTNISTDGTINTGGGGSGGWAYNNSTYGGGGAGGSGFVAIRYAI